MELGISLKSFSKCHTLTSSNMVYMSAKVSHDWNGQDVSVSAGDIEHIHIQYPNYERHDCEARTICFHMGWEGGTNSREISLTAFIKN